MVNWRDCIVLVNREIANINLVALFDTILLDYIEKF